MSPVSKSVIAAAQQLVAKTKSPLLVLNLDTVTKAALLELQSELGRVKLKSLDVILQTPGGDIDAAYIIAKLLKNHTNELRIFVPLYAKSAGTLICLVADELYLNELSELGPLDTQISEVNEGGSAEFISALNGFKALEQVQVHSLESLDVTIKLLLSRSQMRLTDAVKLATEFVGNTSGTMYSKLEPMKIGEYARWLEVGERYGVKLLTEYMGWNDDHARDVVGRLVKDYPHHGYVLDADELKKMGLPVKEFGTESEEEYLEIRNSMLQLEDDLIKLVMPKEGKNEKSKKTS